VNAQDLAFIRRATDPRSYNAFADLNADGSVNALDLAAGKQRLNNRLPSGEPTTAALLFRDRVFRRRTE
jgi:hypothetical protein